MKTKKNLLSSIIITTLFATLLTGCATNGNNALYSVTGNQPPSAVPQQVTSSSEETEKGIDKFAKGIIPFSDVSERKGDYDVKISLTQNQANDFINAIDSYAPIYKYEDLYQLNKALEKDKSYKKATTHATMIDEITGDAIYNAVKDNNEAYLKEHQTKIYKEYKKKELKAICNKVADVVNSQIEASEDVDIDEMKCKLNHLKVFEQGGMMVNATVTYDLCLLINPNMIDILKIMDSDNDMLDVVVHEIIHLVQMECPDTVELNGCFNDRYGFSTIYDDLDVNSLSLLWIAEASAEKCMCNFENMEPMTYQNMINYLESLALIKLLNNDYHVNDMEHLIYKDTINDLYDYFDAKTDSEKRELLNMLYSIQITQQSPDDFRKAYDDYIGHETDDSEFRMLVYELRGEALQSMNRLFYINLSKKLTEGSITLGDVFYLISVYELDLNNHLNYNYYGNFEMNEEAMEQYVEVQDEFFSAIAPNTGMTEEELLSSFNAYTVKYKDGDAEGTNYDMTWLESDKKEYLNQRIDKFDKVLNVRQAYEQFK